MTEPVVTLTDYGLAIECGIFAALIWRINGSPDRLRCWVTVFFISAGSGPLLGGTVHGFFLNEASLGHVILWRISLIAVGVMVLASFSMGAMLIFSEQWIRRIVVAAAVQFVLYTALVLFWNDSFWIAAANYVPAGLFLMVAFTLSPLRRRHPQITLGTWGIGLCFLATALQQLRISLHPEYFNHNALYHLVLAAGLILIFLGARSVLQSIGGSHADST